MNKFIIIFCIIYASEVYAEIIANGDNCGKNCSWEIDDQGTMRIFGTGNMYDYFQTSDLSDDRYHYNDRPWRSFENIVTSLEISPQITSIGRNAFISFTHLQTIQLSNDVLRIEPGGFQGCSQLTSVKFSDNLTYIGDLAFNYIPWSEVLLPETLKKIGNNAFPEGTTLKVYNKKGNIVAKYNSIEALNKGTPTETYKYDTAGHLISIFDSNGQRTWGKKIYTVEEAEAVTAHGDKFHVSLTYK